MLGAACTTTWGKTSKYHRASWLVGVCVVWLYDYDIKKLSIPWYHFKIRVADTFYFFGESLPSIFPLHFRCIYFSSYILLSQNWWQDQFQYLTEKNVLFPLLGTYMLHIISYLPWTLVLVGYGLFFTNWISIFNFLILLLKSQEQQQKI